MIETRNKAAKILLKLGAQNILLKGGHQNSYFIEDVLLNKKEIKLITQNKSNVILCPTTEGNLADGFFKLKEFQENKGNWCLGSDSHIGLSPLEETRLLDYGLRLQTNSRKTFYNNETANASHLVMNKI